MPTWSATQYLKFAGERNRPARDLLAQVPLHGPGLIYDLGCGPGNSTELLVEAFPNARVVGLDHSPEMLAKARKSMPNNEFIETNVAEWTAPVEVDLLYSNATFQWVEAHVQVLQRLLRALKAGGVLAVQMSDNLNEPSHLAMRQAAVGAAYANKMRAAVAAREVLLTPAAYYAALKPQCARLDIWHIIYNHPIEGIAGIVEWVKGTGLRPYLDVLTNEEQGDYLKRYAALLSGHYPVQAEGKVLLRFPRIFIVALK